MLENHKKKLEKRKEKLFRLILNFAVKTVRKGRKHKRHLEETSEEASQKHCLMMLVNLFFRRGLLQQKK